MQFVDLEREEVVAKNLVFFEQSLAGIASRHFFLEAIRCAEARPGVYLAGISCILHGIEGTLSYAIYEAKQKTSLSEDHPMNTGEHSKLNNRTLKEAAKLGFNIEVLAFPEEKGRMLQCLHSNDAVGIVLFRNEFSHGKAHRATEKVGSHLISDTFLLAPNFRYLISTSYDFVAETVRFRGNGAVPKIPTNPLDL